MFRRMDKNKNGSLSREEFALGLKETGLNVTNPEIGELFKVRATFGKSVLLRLSGRERFPPRDFHETTESKTALTLLFKHSFFLS